MFKRKKIILSSVALLISFVIMGFGVYAASNPNVSITGQVTYTASDAKVLVQGKVQNAEDFTSGSAISSTTYKEPANKNNLQTSDKLTNSRSQYLDYTLGTSANDNSDNLTAWSLGSLRFVEDNSGVKDIVISFKLTNYSKYPVKATVTFNQTDAQLQQNNVERTITNNGVTLLQEDMNSKEIVVTLKVLNDSQQITNLDIGMNLTITKDETNVPRIVTFDSNDSSLTFNANDQTTYQVTGIQIQNPNLFTMTTHNGERYALEWYDNPNYTGSPITFPYSPTQNITLYAKWEMNARRFDISEVSASSPLKIMFGDTVVLTAQSSEALNPQNTDYYTNHEIWYYFPKANTGFTFGNYGIVFSWGTTTMGLAKDGVDLMELINKQEEFLSYLKYVYDYIYSNNNLTFINSLFLEQVPITTTGPDVRVFIGNNEVTPSYDYIDLS